MQRGKYGEQKTFPQGRISVPYAQMRLHENGTPYVLDPRWFGGSDVADVSPPLIDHQILS